MAQNLAVESLLKEIDKVLHEKQKMNAIFDAQISELETAIDQLCGKRVWETEPESLYDDTNMDYIKSSVEEM